MVAKVKKRFSCLKPKLELFRRGVSLERKLIDDHVLDKFLAELGAIRGSR